LEARGVEPPFPACYVQDSLKGLLQGRKYAWFPVPCTEQPEQRNNLRLLGKGVGIDWPDLDKDISVLSLLATS
jgi:hypothetical protein